ncbi:MAG: response regulator transcription factor [Crocinitomicaceae bacterium]|nr:response regulator transcription factor [Flavobacteriales bacterium]NQZ38194.1 response regulator transcription factor [Crocinitomicaceae bacterium]
MNKLKVIIVDDEAAARNVLENLLHMSKTNVEILARCSDLPQAVEAIKQHAPDLVFLDVQMPDYAGYEIANFFETIDFEIIFVTAYDQYAIKAFELNAIDYIVKPIERSRLNEALEKVQMKLDQENKLERYQSLLDSIQEQAIGNIVIPELSGGQISKRILRIKDIIAIEAKGAYCQLHLLDEPPFLVSRNLKYLEALLPDDSRFFRSHRSWLLNLSHAETLWPKLGEVHMSKKLIARISKDQVKAFEEQTKG